jgi:signal transduction histidine kinase
LNSVRTRVLCLVAGFGLLTAAALAMVMHQSVRSYYVNLIYNQSGDFLERILESTPDLWQLYESDKLGFSERLQRYTLYATNIGLYLLDNEGHVLATAGEGKIFWSNYRVDLARVGSSWAIDPGMPIWGDDPDNRGESRIVTARPVKVGGQPRGWLYVVARSTDIGAQMPELLRSYAIRTAVKVALLVLAVGVLLTMAMVAVLTRPLTSLTRVVEQVKNSGFQQELSEPLFPYGGRNDEVGRLSRTFRDMFARLKLEMQRVTQTDARRREMVASVSHDLRTPLTALIGQLETVRMKRDTMSAADQQQFVERALLNAQHLKRLTDALAELAKLENPEFSTQREPIAIGELADDVVQRYIARAQDLGVTLTIDYPDGLPLASVDAGLIERALSNLLDNAIRVTPAGGQVRVRVVREGAGVKLEVADTGPGVAAEDQPRVFDRFFQTSQHRELRGSSGLGLAIVKRVAELHGGEVGLTSEPGRGATFYLSLPLAA